MRRVPSEMNGQGERERQERRRKVATVARERRRRLTLEGLERRELLATVPTPLVVNTVNIGDASTTTAWDSTPSIAVNPNNPNQLVSVFGRLDSGQQSMGARWSSDGGTTWNNIGGIGNKIDPTTGTSPALYPIAGEAKVSFDRNNNFYITLLQRNTGNTAGVLDLRKYAWTGAAPVAGATTSIFQWNRTITTPIDHTYDQGIINYDFGVDNTVADYTDPQSGIRQTNTKVGAMYVAATFDTVIPSPPSTWTRYSIHLMSSVDNGATWNGNVDLGADQSLTLNSNANFNSPNSPSLVTRPRLAISQGNVSGTVTAGQVTVIWDDYAIGTATNTDRIFARSANVNMATNTLVAAGGPATVATTFVRGALNPATLYSSYGRAAGQQSAQGVGPNAEIASDNTIGSFSANQGRLYVAYVGFDNSSGNPADNTDIRLATSDNGGLTWTVRNAKVNNDNGIADGKTGAATSGDVQNGLATHPWGRTQFMPSVAVDQYTGAVGLSFYDARDDAANLRVATYVGVSIDGGSSFGGQIYANATIGSGTGGVIDAITGLPVVIGPMGDNQSPGANTVVNGGGNPKQEATIGFGDRQGLVMANGVIHPVWSGNQNGGHLGENNLTIYTSSIGYAKGARVIANTAGVVKSTTAAGVTFNNTFAADGRPIIDAFSVTFDRKVEIASFTPAQVQVWYNDVLTALPTSGVAVPAATIVALDNDGSGGATQFLIRLDQATVQAIYNSRAGGVGTYSYAIGPNVGDRIRYVSTNPAFNSLGNGMDQNANGVLGEAADAFAAPGTKSGVPFSSPYNTTTLPLIVPGPSIASSNVPGTNPSIDNLVTDNSTSAINVTFDRDIPVGSFTPDKVATILGPAGQVLVPQTFSATGVNANVVVPDFPGKPLDSVIAVPSNNTSFPIKSLTVTLNINHTRDSDLKIELIAPDGTKITLADGVGGTGQNFISTTFDNNSKIPITTGTAPFTGSYAPQNAGTPGQGLDAFIGKQLEGPWTLRVTDKITNTFSGVLNGWSLTANPSVTVSVGPQTFSSTTSSTVDIPIPDSPASPLLAPISIPADPFSVSLINNLVVNLSIEHQRDADLKLELIGPDGTTITLANGVGGNGQNFFNTTFDSSAPTSINAGVAPFTGTYAPSSSLGAFNGKQLQGLWYLKVTDNLGNNLTGTLRSWSLTATASKIQTYSAVGSSLNVPVPEAPTAPLNSTVSIANVAVPQFVTGLTVTANIVHPRDSDLTLLLIGPDGTTITLADRVGGNGANFIGTVFSDAGATNISAGAAPFTGTFKPSQALSAFNGKALAGVWTLRAVDRFQNTLTGVVTGWTLNATSTGTQTNNAIGGNTNVPINDNPAAPITSTITIPSLGTPQNITGLKVNLTLTHQQDSDVKIELISPAGTVIVLVDGAGGTGQNYTGTIFDSTSGTSINSGTAPFTGSFAPLESLAGLNGETLAGNWRLRVTDKSANGLTGILRNWSIVATTSANQNFNGAAGAIPDYPATPVASVITVPGASVPLAVAKITLKVTLNHAIDSDLRLELVGPDGTTALLAANVGGNGSNFIDTVFDDAAATSINAGAAPFTGTFQPAGSLASAFIGKLLAGNWTLRVTDQNQNAVTGVIANWSMTATTVSASNTYSSATNLTINGQVPEDVATPLTSVIVVPNYYSGFPIANLKVNLTLAHQQDSDVTVKLVGPDGTTVTLVDRLGGTGQNYTNTTFDSNAAISILAGTAPFTGTFSPLQSLAAFNGKQIVGVWKLLVTDNVGNNLTGSLVNWSFTADPAPGANPTNIRTFRVGFPEQVLRGTYIMSLDPSIRSLTGESGPGAGDAGAKLDTNQNAGVDLLFQRNPAGVNANAQTYSNTTITPIPDKPAAAGVFAPLLSTISIPQGTVDSIKHLSVRLQINHARVSNLKIELVGPDGTSIVLADGVGGNGTSFTATNFDDDGSLTIAAGTSPFTNTYQPAQPLSTFIGKSFIGTWTLRVTDQVTGGAGSLINWSLTSTLPLGIYDSTNTPQNITPATLAPAPGLPNTPSITWSPIQVTDDFVIQAATVNLNITHPNDPDLVGDLLVYAAGVDVSNPNNTETPIYVINLFDGTKGDGNVGASGTRQNFTNTVFDDAATTPIQNGGPPFNGRFNPRTPLSVLVGKNASQYQYVLKVANTQTAGGTLDRWSLSFSKAVANTGLGESVSDRGSVSMRLFSMDPTKPLSSSEWSPVGPAGFSSGKLAGSMTAISVDPTDPSGNTVFVGASSGGVWKTTNFLTNDPQGPTYIPLTDFGPNSGLNTGSIALFARNNDPSQTVVVVGTGDGSMQFGSPMGGIDTSRGVGFLRSFDGGVNWTVLDSLNNVDAQGNLLPLSQRRHEFVGMTVNKVLVDPKLSIAGKMVMYAAVTAPQSTPNPATPAGIYRSLDGGLTWQLKFAGNATDVLFDENSGTVDAVANPAGNYRILFAAMGGQGVFRSSNQGDRWDQMSGGIGNPTIQDATTKTPIPVINNPTVFAGQRIVLARPALTGNVNQDVQYQNWVYAAVTWAPGGLPNGVFAGLYVTKDLGQNWTQIRLPNANQSDGSSADLIVPANNIAYPDYDVTQSGNFQMGLYNLSLAVDPTNPAIVYVGGTRLAGGRSDGLNHISALIRVDTTALHDPHAFYMPSDQADGGLRQVYSGSPITVRDKFNPTPNPAPPNAVGTPDLNPYINLVRDPNQPFLSNTTIYVHNVVNFSNDGAGVIWTGFDGALAGSGGLHQIVTVKDPLTGLPRLIIADDQGVYTGIDNKGQYLSRIGNTLLPLGSRNGNLQTAQFYYGAAQPSSAASQASQALFYAQSQGNGFPESNKDIITPGTAGYGDLHWVAPSIGYGTGVATDQTGTGSVYKYKWPSEINDGVLNISSSLTDFFKVKPNGGSEVSRTFNLIQSSTGGQVPDPQWPFSNRTGQPNVGNFAVNPLTGNQVIIGSLTGRLFGTENQGAFWNVLANPGDLDGTYVQAPAFGAPDPNGPGVPGALNNYILAGTRGGRIFVTLNGGGSGGSSNNWFDISSGLVNNDPIMAIITNPTRGSHEAYAVSTSHVYRNTNTSLRDANGVVVGAGWVDITGDIFSQTHNAFGDALLTENVLTPNSLTSVVADWRYVLPDTPPSPANPTPPTHPMLYVAGQGGVLRTSNGISTGAKWSVFPDISLNAPQANGGLPSVNVTDLDMALGNINPTTGRPDVSTGPNVLLATTYGRGSYAIKLAPIVFKETVHLNASIPAPGNNNGLPGGSDSGRPTVNVGPGGVSSVHPGDLTDLYTNVLTPIFQGLSEQSAFGGKVAITLFDATDPYHPVYIGGYDPSQGPVGTNPTFNDTRNQTDTFGNFSVQVNAGVWTAQVSDGVKVIRVQATDQAGTRGNLADFTFTLDTTSPTKPDLPTLSPSSDSGFSNSDNYTNVVTPGIVVLPTEGNITVYLLRKLASDPGSAYQVVNTLDLPPLLNGASPVPVTIVDPGPLVDASYTYAVQEIDPAGNLGPRSADSPVITIDTIKPNAPSRPTLSAGSDSGTQGDNITNIVNPIFSIGTAEADPTRVYLKRNGAIVPNTGNPSNPRLGPGSIQDPGPLVDATYAYVAYQQDLAGNISADSAVLNVRILTAGPSPIPTVALYPDDDTGVKGDNATKVRQPRLYGTAPIPPAEGYTIQLVQLSPPPSGNPILATTPVPNTGNYVIQFPAALPDGQITIEIRVLDVAGNTTASAPLTLSINTAPPAITPTLRIRDDDDTGIKGDNKTTARKPFLVGDTTPGAIVDLLDANNVVVATTTALSAPSGGHPAGYFQAQLPLELSNGTITVRARARDNVGNVNPNVGTLQMTIYTATGDINNEGKAQIAVYRPSNGVWYIRNGDGSQYNVSHGWPNHDVPMQADYNGDGRVDVTVYRPETATWYINRGGNLGQYNVQWGWAGHDTPVPTDYDGDGKADIAVYRPETADWYVLGSAITQPVVNFGWPGHDKPVPADYQNLGKSQIAVWRPETGQWFIRNANGSTQTPIVLGQMGDIPQPGDYRGTGYVQPAVYRPSTGQYFIYDSSNPQTPIVFNVGAANSDTPVAADYDGDGKFDPAVYRSATADWRILGSKTNHQVSIVNYGWPLNDIAIPGPLAYRVAGVNNPSMGVPASDNLVNLRAIGPVAATASTDNATKTPAKPVVVVGAVTPRAAAKQAVRQAQINKILAYAQSNPKVLQRLTQIIAKHPLVGIDRLLHQLKFGNGKS